ncbi:MAG TPA: cyclic nucleotide-binding domain-containing protein, partial [Tepidisphaeraceae bacterium]|nr:cyclic nucleotide-binding domain-containing protein [Tepidisphaeraceae bacterium]
LAGRIKTAPFVRGETITRQGTRGDWLYLLVTGRAEVKVATDNGGGRDSRHVADLRPGDFFGEMGLMTGGERTATVVATTDSTCYRIDKADLEPILATRPEIAEDVAQILARRRTELDAVREDLNEDAKRRRMSEAQGDLLQRIRRFFTLGE